MRVGKLSAIGQILACPKCGTMLEIKPPPDWEPPADSKVRPVQGQGGGDASRAKQPETSEPSGSFEDIDKILNTSEVEQAAIQQIRQLPAPKPKRVRAKIQNPASPPTDGPILPTDDWTSREAQQRKKWIAIVSAIVGAILICFAVVIAVINSGPKNEDSVADNNEVQKVSEPESDTGKADSETNTDPGPDIARLEEPVADITNLDEPVPLSMESNRENAIPPTDAAKADFPQQEPPPSITAPPTIATDPVTTDPALPSDSPLIRSPISSSPLTNAAEPTDSRPSGLSNLDSLRSEMGELAELLEQSGTSILKMQDLAEANREQQLIGIPKYFIEQPDWEQVDLEKQLSLRCGGVRYRDSRLIAVLRDITALTGVPFTLDIDSMQANLTSASGEILNPTVSLDVKDLDFAGVVDAIIEPLGLSKTTTENQGLLIRATMPPGYIEQKYQLPEFLEVSEQASEPFIACLQGLFAPQSWVRKQEPATIELAGNEFVVKNTILVQHQIRTFIDKLQAAENLKKDPDDQKAKGVLTTKWNAVSELLQQPTGLQKSTDGLLTDLLNKIFTKSGITVLVDWEHVMPLGWSPATKVPGIIDEENVGEALQQLARSMNLTIRAVDPVTLELTTFEQAARAVDLEVFYLGNVLAGPLNQQQMLRLITETLGSQLQSPLVRWHYEPNCQCLILLAPQSLQRQTDSVIRQLERL